MKKKKAKRLAIEKWQAIVNAGGEDLGGYTITSKMRDKDTDCAYCYKYLVSKGSCKKCPICPPEYDVVYERIGCLYSKHPFNIWADNNTPENALVVLELIMSN